jgi:hypothetical protein
MRIKTRITNAIFLMFLIVPVLKGQGNLPPNFDVNRDGVVNAADMDKLYQEWPYRNLYGPPFGMPLGGLDVRVDGIFDMYDVIVLGNELFARSGGERANLPYLGPAIMTGARPCPLREATVNIKGLGPFLTAMGGGHPWLSCMRVYVDGFDKGALTSAGLTLQLQPGTHQVRIRPAWWAMPTPAMAPIWATEPIIIEDLKLDGYTGFGRYGSSFLLPNGKTSVSWKATVTPKIYDQHVVGSTDVTNFYTISKFYSWSLSYIAPPVYNQEIFTWACSPGVTEVSLTAGFSVTCGTGLRFEKTTAQMIYISPSSNGGGYSPKEETPPKRDNNAIAIRTCSAGVVEILSGTGTEGDASIVMTDILGRVVLNDHMSLDGERQHSINLASMNIPSGIYLIRVDAAGIVKTVKVRKR